MAAFPAFVLLGEAEALVAALGAAVITGSVIENTVADGAFRAAASMATTTTASATVVPVPVVAPAVSATSASLAAPVIEATTVAAKPTATAFSKALSVALPIAAGTAVAAGALYYFLSPSAKVDTAYPTDAPPAQNKGECKENKDGKSNKSSKLTSVGKDAAPPGNGLGGGSGPPNNGGPKPPRKDILIPLRLMEKILEKDGREIYDKLRKIIPNLQRTIWSDRNFRIDPGHTVNGQTSIKTWNLQMNKGADALIKKRLKDCSTHTKLLWGTFDLENPPSYDEWVRGILEPFK